MRYYSTTLGMESDRNCIEKKMWLIKRQQKRPLLHTKCKTEQVLLSKIHKILLLFAVGNCTLLSDLKDLMCGQKKIII